MAALKGWTMLRANCLTAAAAAAQMLMLAGLAQAEDCPQDDRTPRCVMLRDLEQELAKSKALTEQSKSLTLPSPSRPSSSFSSGSPGGTRALGNLKEEESLRLNRQILEQLK
jgi:hypothetical protein